jgi:hypothetical protein
VVEQSKAEEKRKELKKSEPPMKITIFNSIFLGKKYFFFFWALFSKLGTYAGRKMYILGEGDGTVGAVIN